MWLPPLVGAPNPSLPNVNPATPWAINPSTPNGPIASATVNVYLLPIAKAEAAADAKNHHADELAGQAQQTHDGYAEAFAAIGAATGAWRDVQRLATKIAKADDQQSSPEKTADMHAAKVAVPGIMASANHAIQALLALHHALKADQAAHRPDLPPAAHVPDEGGGFGWGGLAIGFGIVYLLWKAVF